MIGASDTIIGYLIRRKVLSTDETLRPDQRTQNCWLAGILDDLYWVVSYSRWKDDRFWPLFQDAMLRTHPNVRWRL
ncbi:MAG: glutathione S-transferase family protein, partial [Rhodospirillales bacterium]|nr:glutathione S-transferase family protein [Rhodospirillales bacterium]